MASPTVNSLTASVAPLSSSAYTNAILYGTKWGTGIGLPISLTYSFPPLNSSTWLTNYSSLREPYSYGGLSSSQQHVANLALGAWSNVSNIAFKKLDDTSKEVGEIRFAWTNGISGSQAHAYYPSNSPSAGDVWLNRNASGWGDFSAGTYGHFTLLHEIGHALGLKHSFEASYYSTSTLPSNRDGYPYSIMSYSAYPGERGSIVNFNPTTPMLYDIAAIQHLYGVNKTYNSGNNTYTFTQGTSYLQTIWDGGGMDTIVWSGTTEPCTIDLRAGAWSDLGNTLTFMKTNYATTTSRNTVTIAIGCTIENATGGNANDILNGNEVANQLSGGKGDDVLRGFAGNDLANGGEGVDTYWLEGRHPDYIFKLTSGVVTVADTGGNGDGSDTLINIEFVYFRADNRTLSLDDVIANQNILPTSANALLTVTEEVASKLLATSFKFTDADIGQTLQKVVITTLPTLGTLKLSGVALQTNDEISIANINAGNLTYVSASNGSGLAYSTIGFKVHDGIAPSASSYTLTFNAKAVNDAPAVANAIADQAATEGTAFSLSVDNAFTDVDTGDVLKLSATMSDGKALPAWLKFTASTGTFAGAPMDADSSKTINVMVKATDKAKAVASDTFAIVIEGVNVAPTAKAITVATSATENLAFTYAIPKGTFTDSDSGDLLAYSATGLPPGLSINTSTGTITGKLSFAGADTPQRVITLTATDRAGLSASTNLKLNVQDVQTITGTSAADTLVGGAGADVITGGARSDQLTGGAGADQFKFDQAPGTTNLDTITDFVSGTDKLILSVKIFKALGTKAGAITSAQFVQGAGLTTGQDATDRLVFNTANSTLY
jgi:serralysin